MGESAQRIYLTAEDLYDLPDDAHRYELAAGFLIRMPPAGFRHGAIAVRIARLLDEYAEAQDLGRVCGSDTGFILQRNPDIVRAPDVAFVPKAQLQAHAEERERFWPVAPALAVEVVSPSDPRARCRRRFASTSPPAHDSCGWWTPKPAPCTSIDRPTRSGR